jgi:hypothetical protein
MLHTYVVYILDDQADRWEFQSHVEQMDGEEDVVQDESGLKDYSMVTEMGEAMD